MGTLKQISTGFQSCWADRKSQNILVREEERCFFTFCLKSDRIKESLRNVSDRIFSLVEEKSLKLKREGSLCEFYLQTVPDYLSFLFILNTLSILKYLRILREGETARSKVAYHSNYQFWSWTLAFSGSLISGSNFEILAAFLKTQRIYTCENWIN